MRYCIENEFLKVAVNSLGGALTSVYDKRTNEELLWQKDSNVWGSQDIWLFPVISRPTFEIDGVQYRCNGNHGVIRPSICTETANDGFSMTIEKAFDDVTLTQYPFKFNFKVIYSLDCDKLNIKVIVTSLDGEKMPFMLGSHAGFYIKNGEANVDFDGEQHFSQYYVTDGGAELGQDVVANGISVNKELFNKYDSVMLANHNGKHFEICDGSGLTVRYDVACPCLCIWSKADGGDYICVEPWWGMPPIVGETSVLADKKFINFAEKEPKTFDFSITFIR